MQLRVECLNHASLILEVAGVRLLSDPWFSGTAFSGGWGLAYDNPDALEQATRATHLWISHWHSDHLHVPTLQALVARNADMQVLANQSANFSLAERMRSLGFRNVVALGERAPLSIAHGVTVVRYPTAGIDNMLHVQAPGWSILNYNDCNLRPLALRALARRIGPIDLLLNNYNHAGKLFEMDSDAEERDKLWSAHLRVADRLQPRQILPFASSHYYRCAQNQHQNRSLLTFDELEQRTRGDARFVVLRIGDSATLEAPGAAPQYARRTPPLKAASQPAHDYGPSVPWTELLEAARGRCKQLREGYPVGYRAVPELRVRLHDQDRVLVLDLHGEPREAGAGGAHIAAHSRAVHDWLGRRFGDDSFVAGAHFEICDPDLHTIKIWVALSLLEASHLSVRDVLRYLRTHDGLRFLWCRREEIVATLTGGPLKAGEMRA